MEADRLSLRELMDTALRNSPLSQNQAAKAAGITGPRWRQIVNGFEHKGGQRILINGPAETLARMALAIDVTPDELRRAKRPDAAKELEDLIHPVDGDFDYQSLDGLQAARQQSLAFLRRAKLDMTKAGRDVELAMARFRNAVTVHDQASAEAERLAQLIADRIQSDIEHAQAHVTQEDYDLAAQHGDMQEGYDAIAQREAGEEPTFDDDPR